MFDKHLFYELCEKYGVELSKDYTKPMLDVDGKIREISEQDIKSLVSDYQEFFCYHNNMNMYTMIIDSEFEMQDQLIA